MTRLQHVQDKLVNSMTKEDFESATGPEDEVRDADDNLDDDDDDCSVYHVENSEL